MKKRFALVPALLLALVLPALSQDWIRTGTGVGGQKIRLAVPDFKLANADPNAGPLDKTFNEVVFNDLLQSGIFDMVSKSFYPLAAPGAPADLHLDVWAAPPVTAAMLAFGNLGVSNGTLQVQGWLYDAKNAQTPQILAKQYRDTATDESARMIAHRFADEIIFRLGGGINGISETKLYYVSTRSGHKEIWGMDYDGANQHAITHLNSISLSPRISPDNSRLAFVTFFKSGAGLAMWSMDLGRLLKFPAMGGTTLSPAWSSDGAHLAFSSSRSGDPEIYVCNPNGGDLKRLTNVHGPDVSPVWNPKNQLADRLGQRAHRPAADLHHGVRRHQRAAPHRPGLCGFALLVPQRTVPGLRLDSPLWPRRTRSLRHLHHGRSQPPVGAAHT